MRALVSVAFLCAFAPARADVIEQTRGSVRSSLDTSTCTVRRPTPKVLIPTRTDSKGEHPIEACAECRWELVCQVTETYPEGSRPPTRTFETPYRPACPSSGENRRSCPGWERCIRESTAFQQSGTGNWTSPVIGPIPGEGGNLTMREYAGRADSIETKTAFDEVLSTGATSRRHVRARYARPPDYVGSRGGGDGAACDVYCVTHAIVELWTASPDSRPVIFDTQIGCPLGAGGMCPTATECYLSKTMQVLDAERVIPEPGRRSGSGGVDAGIGE